MERTPVLLMPPFHPQGRGRSIFCASRDIVDLEWVVILHPWSP